MTEQPQPQDLGEIWGNLATQAGNAELTRRESLEAVCNSVLAYIGRHRIMAAASALLSSAADAEASYWSWEWWPKRTGIVNDYGIVMSTLHQRNGSLAVHDSETGKHAREWEEDLANWMHDNYPDADAWAGGCYAKASTIILEEKPVDVIGEGLLVAKHAGDLMIPVEPGLIIPRYIRSRRIAVESPKNWWSVADRAVGGDSIERTNFGFSRRVTPLGAIFSAYIPYHYNDPAELSGGLVQYLELEANQTNLRLKNPELDIDFVNFRAYHR